VEGAIGALIGARRYEDARALAQAAAPRLQTNAEALGGMIQRTEVASLGNDALSTVKRYYLSMYEGLSGKTMALSLFSKDNLHTQDTWDAFHRLYNADMVPGVNADLSLQVTQFEVKEGDEKGLEVVTTRNKRSLSFYMVKEGNDWKIRAMGWESEEIAREARQLLEGGDKAAAGRWLGWLVNLKVESPELHFMKLYSAKDESRWDVALAAFLAPYGDTAAIKLLEAQDRSKDVEGAPMGVALFWAYIHQKDYARAEKVLAEIQPKLEAKIYQELHWSLWDKQENLESLEKELLSALEKDPKDVQLLYRLAKVYSKRADYAGVVRVQQQIQQSGKASPNDLNNLAWFSLYVTPLPPDTEAKARAAWKQSPDESTRHTLACVLVAVGKTEEARQLLIEHLDGEHLDQPEAAWWYVIGQMQERLGMPQLAIAAYTSALADDGETATLARRRLAALKP
jgi:tetratricopeptide (TPR) repeat protein